MVGPEPEPEPERGTPRADRSAKSRPSGRRKSRSGDGADPLPRFDSIDILRGFAMVWMTVFHSCYDLNTFGYIKQDFYTDPIWTWQRTCILSLFLFTAGFSQSVAVSQGQSWKRFWRRWAQIAACAVLVTAGSYWMFPKTFIYFGVLHAMLVMLIIVRVTARWGFVLWVFAGLTLLAGWAASLVLLPSALADLLNSRSLNWIGWVSRKPHTEDFVPLIPWLGVMWLGAATGALAMRRGIGSAWLSRATPAQRYGRPGVQKLLSALGRWSLTYYMLHQPVMIGALAAVSWLGSLR